MMTASAFRAPLDSAALDKVLQRRNWQTILSLYLSESREVLEAVRTAVQHGNSMGLWASAHRLKGSSSYVGASQVQALSAELERLGRENVVNQRAVELVTQLEHEFERAARALELACGVRV